MTTCLSRRRRLLRRISCLGATAALAFPSLALAQDNPSFGGGVFLGYAFGAHQGFGWGLEAFATHRFENASAAADEPRSGLGPLLQLELIGLRDPRLTLALQAGREIERNQAALSGELGVSYRLGDRPGFGVHTGALLGWFVSGAGFRYQWLLDDAWVGGSVRVQPTFGDAARVEVGRPLRAADGSRLSGALQVAAGGKSRAPCRDRVASAGEDWARDAQQECDSVSAFLQLAAELLVHGAPDALVVAALDAAEDEIRHAALCAAIASRHLGRRVRPTLPVAPRRADLPREAALLRFAREAYLDGAIAEGTAARYADRAAELCTDPATRESLRSIARDEHRHAELGWKVLRWAAASGGTPVRDLLGSLRRIEPAAERSETGDAVPAHGRLGAAEVAAVERRHTVAARRRLERVLAASSV